MTKQELLIKLNELHSQIISLQDEAVDAWREATAEDDEQFFSDAGNKLADIESDLSSFISDNTEDLPISAEPITIEELEELDLDEEFDEAYEEMNEDPEEFFKKNMESED